MTQPTPTADLILHRGLFTTLARSQPTATAVAIRNGRFLAVGTDKEVIALAGPKTKVVDLKGRRVLPGLIDNHLHIIRGGLNFNLELRWDGVRSLAEAMNMLKRQVAVTPPPQWVRVVGYTKETPNPPGGEIVHRPDGTPTGLLLAKPNAGILYATLAKGPKLPFDYQLSSTRHFMRELNRLGVTGAIDAGGGFQNYPEDYAVVQKLAADG